MKPFKEKRWAIKTSYGYVFIGRGSKEQTIKSYLAHLYDIVYLDGNLKYKWKEREEMGEKLIRVLVEEICD